MFIMISAFTAFSEIYKHIFSPVLQGVVATSLLPLSQKSTIRRVTVTVTCFLIPVLDRNELGIKQLTIMPVSNIMFPRIFLELEAYPLKCYVLRPFHAFQLGPSKTTFNKHLSQTR